MKDEIKKSLETLFSSGDVIEFRIPKTQYDGTVSGYFNDFDKLADAATKYNGIASAIYITINPVNPALLARANNRVKTKAQTTTGDAEITKRIWLPIDLDCQRPVGISSSEDEHNKANEKAKEIIDILKGFGWSEPIYADSGNGAHLLYKIDMPNNDSARDLLADFLKALSYLVDTDLIKVDQTVFNAARIWKLYGTTTGKGDSLPDRPHRKSKILNIPEKIEIVTVEQIKEIINLMPVLESPEYEYKNSKKFNMVAWLDLHKMKVQNTKTDSTKTVYILEECPYNHEHKDAHIVEMNTGMLGFKCFRAGCEGYSSHWSGMRERVEPGYKERKKKKSIKEKKIGKLKETEVEPELVEALGLYRDNMELAEEMQKIAPIYYDVSKNLWLWKHNEKFWKRIDEIDILSKARKVSNEYILNSKIKSELIDGLKITGRERDVKDLPKKWIQFKDCVVDFTTGEKLKATPDYFFTTPIPHALGSSKDTPMIDKLFNDWVGNDAYKLYELVAYCMLNNYPIHRMFFLFGRGRNGKGQFMELVERFIGGNNTTSTDLERLIESKFEAAKLYTKRVAFIGETNFNILRNTASLKKLTGDDKIGGEFKNKDPFDFWNAAKLIISTNSLPTTLDKTDAFYARCLIFEFKNQFPLSKKVVETIPEEEYENLGFKCLDILKQIIENGLFTNEGTIEERGKKYERLSNPLDNFINTHCIKVPNGYEAAWKIFDAYKSYCVEKGYRPPHSKTEFNNMLRENYDVEKKNIDGNQWVWVYGLNLKDDFTENLPVLPVLPEISHSSICAYLSENEGKTGKTGNNDSSRHQENLPSSSIYVLPKTGNPVTQNIDFLQKNGEKIDKNMEKSGFFVENMVKINEFRDIFEKKNGKINSANLTQACIEYCNWEGNGTKPSDIKEILEKIFKITPPPKKTEPHLSYLCKNGQCKDCGGAGCDCDCHNTEA